MAEGTKPCRTFMLSSLCDDDKNKMTSFPGKVTAQNKRVSPIQCGKSGVQGMRTTVLLEIQNLMWLERRTSEEQKVVVLLNEVLARVFDVKPLSSFLITGEAIYFGGDLMLFNFFLEMKLLNDLE
ncbi:hypothetical protein VNO78_10436 [Psophocarpus tetragonolobus]|uniref:Uncharacterized protein n=1 Tax=Psophocarpus tetragonolobus TaxID=3891 RepID=A0AAN9SLA5_PSOTE